MLADSHRIAFGPAIFLHYHCVATCRYRRPGEYPGGLTGFQRLPDCAGRDALGHPQPGRCIDEVGDAHGVAIHGAVVQRRNVDRRSQALGKYPPQRVGRGDLFGFICGPRSCQQKGQRIVSAEHVLFLIHVL